jgi:hypothetical protein
MQGYLWKQSNNIARDWQRRWFLIEGGHLWYMQTDTGNNKPLIGAGGIVGGNMNLTLTAASRDPAMHNKLLQAVERKVVCSLMISTVKELKGPSELKFCFQVISPGKRVYVLQAESLEEYTTWVTALRTEIELSLSKVQTSDAHSSNQAPLSNMGASMYLLDDKEGEQSTIVLSETQQSDLRRMNNTCADCGIDGPEWASVNNGIMVCIECCGVHRSLGTHVSKARSLRLDRCVQYTQHSILHLLSRH